MANTGGLTFGDELATTVVSGQDDLNGTDLSRSQIQGSASAYAPHPLMADSGMSTNPFLSATNASSFFSATSAAHDPGRASAMQEPLKQSTASAYDSVNLSASTPPAQPVKDDDPEPPQPPALLPPGPASSAELKVAVHSARKTWGPTALPGVDEFYMSYTVSTVTTLPNYAVKEMNVKRRFRDVVDLTTLLWTIYPGSFIPARPKRNMVEGRRMTPQFVQIRQASMERFLNRLAAHPLLGRSEELKCFLEVEGDLRNSMRWAALHPAAPNAATSGLKFIKQIVGLQRTTPTPAEVTQSTAASKDVFRIIHERVATLTGRLPHDDLPQQEGILQEQGQMYEELRKELAVAAARADDAMNRMREAGEAVGDLGVALVGLHKFEEQHHTASARPCSIAGQAALKAYKQGRAAAERSRVVLMPLQDISDAMPCVAHALQQRTAALTTALTLRADLGATQHRLEMAKCQPQPSPKQVENLRRTEELLDASSRAAMTEYHRIAARNLEDSRTFQRSCEVEFHHMLRDLADAQQAHWAQQKTIWVDMARALGADPRSLTGW